MFIHNQLSSVTVVILLIAIVKLVFTALSDNVLMSKQLMISQTATTDHGSNCRGKKVLLSFFNYLGLLLVL